MHQPVETDHETNEELKYAIVELIANKGRGTSIDCGLLRGIGRDDKDDFLWLVTDKKVSRACNLTYFNILSIVVFDGIAKRYKFFMADEDEQIEARKSIERAYEGLKKLALPENATLLDVSKFQEVPENFGKLSKISLDSCANRTGAPTKQTDNHDWYGKGSNSNNFSHVKSDPEPFFWKRKSRKPTKKALEILREKLDLIAKREYEFMPCAIESGKKEDEEDKESEKADCSGCNGMFQGYEDENFPFGP